MARNRNSTVVEDNVIQAATAIRLRLSAAQMSLICLGLDLLIRSYASRLLKGGIRYEYPFRIYPPPVGFDRGAFDQDFMDKITALWKHLRPKAKTGGRIQMDTIELRGATFAIRAFLDSVRMRKIRDHRSRPELKAKSLIEDESLGQLKIRSRRVINTLERYTKRANRALLKSVAKDAYGALMDAWTKHVRWMSLHIAYFKEVPVIPGRRILQQQILDDLMKMAEHGIRNAGFQPPKSRELRRIMRLFVRSARRGREGSHDVSYLLHHDKYFPAKVYLGQFVLRRLTLEQVQQ